MVDISLRAGNRAFLCGGSGSGKTTLALRLCEAMPSPLVIVDTKYDPVVAAWGKARGIKLTTRKMPEWRSIDRDMIIRPSSEWLANPEDLDWWLGQAFQCKYKPSIYIDEGYQVGATASKMGEGITGLWTRSRVFGFRCLLAAQRPAWISQFVITESDVLFIGKLNSKKDRQKIFECTDVDEAKIKQERHNFLYIRQDGDDPVRLKPIDLSKSAPYVASKRDETRVRLIQERGGLFSFLRG